MVKNKSGSQRQIQKSMFILQKHYTNPEGSIIGKLACHVTSKTGCWKCWNKAGRWWREWCLVIGQTYTLMLQKTSNHCMCLCPREKSPKSCWFNINQTRSPLSPPRCCPWMRRRRWYLPKKKGTSNRNYEVETIKAFTQR